MCVLAKQQMLQFPLHISLPVEIDYGGLYWSYDIETFLNPFQRHLLFSSKKELFVGYELKQIIDVSVLRIRKGRQVLIELNKTNKFSKLLLRYYCISVKAYIIYTVYTYIHIFLTHSDF